MSDTIRAHRKVNLAALRREAAAPTWGQHGESRASALMLDAADEIQYLRDRLADQQTPPAKPASWALPVDYNLCSCPALGAPHTHPGTPPWA